MPSNFLPRRVVCLQPSATVVFDRLGLLDRVVACTKYCAQVCPQLSAQAIVADSWTAKADEILTTHPDLVIASVPYQVEAVVQILKSGARFLGLAPKNLADIYADISAIAGLMHACDRGAQLVREMQQAIESLRRQTNNSSKRPLVFCEEWGKPIIHSQPWVAELVEAAGGDFLGEPGKHTDAEIIRRAHPEVIIAAWCGAGDRVPLEKMVQSRGWTDLTAVIEGRVYAIKDELLNTPAPTLIAGLHALAAAIHPEVFPRAPGLRRISSEALCGRAGRQSIS